MSGGIALIDADELLPVTDIGFQLGEDSAHNGYQRREVQLVQCYDCDVIQIEMFHPCYWQRGGP